MRTLFSLSVATLLAAGCATAPKPAIQPPSAFLDAGPRPKLMFVGTFHFADAGLDSYKPQHDINILDPARQREVEQLVERLARFRPTKVAIEVRADGIDAMNQRYRDYLAGKFELKSNEIYQIGFRLAKRMGHAQVYGVDVWGRNYYTDEQWEAEKKALNVPDGSPWDERFKKLYAYDDELKTKLPLIDFFRYLNSPERVRAGHGHYLTGTFHAVRGENYFGPDNLSGWWYDRNLRIFANVTNLATSPDDRVLVLIGAGHLPVLLHAAQSSPEVEWIDVESVLR